MIRNTHTNVFSQVNLATAERCGIKHLIDPRHSGFATGVGRARILGRVNLAVIKIGGAYLYSTFTVIEDQDIELLLGLDMLRRFKCIVDLSQNVLRVDNKATPFLSEKDIGRQVFGAQPSLSQSQLGNQSGKAQPRAVSRVLGSVPSSEDKARELVALGFSRSDSENALAQAGGDVCLAAKLLFS